MRNPRVYVLALMVLGAVLRLDVLLASNWVIDSDEAIVGLMAHHLASGKAHSVPIFYYGQNYMGSLEPMLVSILFWITGATSSPVLLKLVPFLFSIALIPLGFLLGKEISSGHRESVFCGLFAAAYLALPPAPLVVWSSMARGGFIEIVVMAVIALLLAIRWARLGQPAWYTCAIGLVLGLGWWTNNQIIYAILPVGLWMIITIWRNLAWPFAPMLKHFLIGIVSFVVGGLPFWWFNLTHNFISFEMFSGAKGTKLLPQVGELFTVALPIILGAKRFWHVADIFPGATALVWSALTLALVIYILVRRTSCLKLSSPLDLVVLYAITTCAVFALSSFGWLTSAPRYLLPLYPAIAIMFGALLSGVMQFSYPLAALGCILTLCFNLSSLYLGKRALPGQPVVANGERVAESHQELISWLTAHNVSMVETNYWIGYRLAFETGEAIRFRVFGDPAMVRIKEYEEIADKIPLSKIPLILVPSQLPGVTQALTELGFTYRSEMVGGYAVIADRASKLEQLKQINPSRFTVEANLRSEFANLAIDGSSETRWGSGTPQRPGIEYTVSFKEPVNLKGLFLDWRDFPPDYPRGLEITAQIQNKEVVLLSGEQYRKMQPLSNKVGEISLFVENDQVSSLRFRQLGSDSKFDWSIAEMRLYE